MPGKKFGKWTVTPEFFVSNGMASFMCICECGRRKLVTAGNLIIGNSTQCSSCARKKHGMNSSPEYERWEAMIQRCHNEKCKAYKNYGARGIIVCERWRNSFEAFFKDMGKYPSSKHTLERIDNQLGYFPENCRWATWKDQHNNKRTNHWLEYNGERHTTYDKTMVRNSRHDEIQSPSEN